MTNPIISELRELQSQFQAKAKEALRTSFKKFFESHPEVSRIMWTQYTPYFNDGDACTFSINELTFKASGMNLKPDVNKELGQLLVDDDDIDDVHGYSIDNVIKRVIGYEWGAQKREIVIGTKRLPTPTESSLLSDTHDLNALVQELGETMKDIFGDHALVTATIEGFEVKEYEHD